MHPPLDVKAVYEDENILILDKPSGIASVPLKKGEDTSFLSHVLNSYPECASVKGKNEWEKGVLHRLDTPTSGLIMVAKTQEAYEYYSNEQRKGRITKIYRVRVGEERSINPSFEAFPFEMGTNEISSRFRSYGRGRKEVRPVYNGKRADSDKIYVTRILSHCGAEYLVSIDNGFRHQIRAHFAWMGFPLLGDDLYGGQNSPEFGLRAVALSFIEFKSGKRIKILSDQVTLNSAF